jgi:cytidylate kinase
VSPSFRTITVSREFGTGGHPFCRALGQALAMPVFGSEILSLMAKEMKTSEEIVDTYEKMRYGASEFFLTTLATRYSFLGKEIIESRRYIDSMRQVMLKLVSLGKVIILGRGGQCILRDQPDCLHLRLVAEPEDRVARLAGLDRYASFSHRQLVKLLKEKDAYRAEFTRKHFHRDIGDPTLYHLTVNFSQLSPERAAPPVISLCR